MGDLLAQLLSTLLEIFFEFVLQMLFELAAEALSAVINRGRQSSPAVSMVGLAFAGAAAGLMSVWLFPHRLIGVRAVLPGVSLLLAPMAAGSAMHLLGNRLRRLGRNPSSLATFGGGALFAFSMALIRWWLIGRLIR